MWRVCLCVLRTKTKKKGNFDFHFPIFVWRFRFKSVCFSFCCWRFSVISPIRIVVWCDAVAIVKLQPSNCCRTIWCKSSSIQPEVALLRNETKDWWLRSSPFLNFTSSSSLSCCVSCVRTAKTLMKLMLLLRLSLLLMFGLGAYVLHSIRSSVCACACVFNTTRHSFRLHVVMHSIQFQFSSVCLQSCGRASSYRREMNQTKSK